MDRIKVEAFLSIPPCSGGVAVSRLLSEAQEQFGDKLDVVVHRGPDESYEVNKITACPALIIGNLVRFVGLCPSKESFIGALREAGL